MSLRCLICHREIAWEKNPWRPFCSERCQLLDLGAWASELYRMPLPLSGGSESMRPSNDADDDDEK